MRIDPAARIRFWKLRGGPDWRHKWASALPPERAITNECDPLVQELHAYLALADGSAAGNLRAADRHPNTAAAVQINANTPLVELLKLLVLAAATTSQITERTGLPAEFVALWEQLFFDVRDHIAARGWIHAYVIAPQRELEPSLASRMKFAYGGGLEALDVLQEAESSLSSDTGVRQRQFELRLALQLDQALERLPTSPADSLELLKLHVTMHVQDQKLELARRRFDEKTTQALHKQERAQARRDAQQLKAARVAEAERRQHRPVRALPTAALLALSWPHRVRPAEKPGQNAAADCSLPVVVSLAQPTAMPVPAGAETIARVLTLQELAESLCA